MNISHYLYPNYYNILIGTFSFSRYLLVKRHFWYISNMKGCVLSIDTFFIKMCFRYISNMKGYVISINTFSYIYIYIYGTLIFTKKISILEFSTLFILQMNTLQPYIIITIYPCIYLYIYNINMHIFRVFKLYILSFCV